MLQHGLINDNNHYICFYTQKFNVFCFVVGIGMMNSAYDIISVKNFFNIQKTIKCELNRKLTKVKNIIYIKTSLRRNVTGSAIKYA